MNLIRNTLHNDYLREIGVFPIGDRDLINFSYSVDKPCFNIGLGFDISYETPLNIGLTFFGLRCYLQIFSFNCGANFENSENAIASDKKIDLNNLPKMEYKIFIDPDYFYRLEDDD